MNTINLIGRLTKDPELKYIQGTGNAVARFTIAVDRGFTKKDGTKETDFINIEVWNKSAENCANYIAKGSLVGVTGSLRIENYKDQQGEFKSFTKVLASNIQFLNAKNTTATTSAPSGAQVDAQFEEVDGDEEIPF